MSLTIYLFLFQSESHEAPIVEPISEENLDTMVDLNQVGNPGDSSEPSNLDASNIENPVDSPLVAHEILPLESLETSNSQVNILSNSLLEFYASTC